MAGPEYRYEYVSASVAMGPIISGVEWSLDISMANRGETTEHFRVRFIRSTEPFEILDGEDHAVDPLRTVRHGLGVESDPGIQYWDQWWVSILATSRNLVPTMRFHVDPTPPPLPEFFFGPGDFAVFPLRVFVEPPLGPAAQINPLEPPGFS
jgi:hypothetical protein